ncbi:MAG: hypothetical protein H0T73_13500, partial [Ardenticatenales bacterium]|nr:hypothetical protein [Ardenticatenales bacterium]
MACEHNRHEFFDRTAEALQKLPKKAQPILRVGETTLPLSGASLQRIYQSAMNGTRVGALSEEKRGELRRKTVEVMRWFDLAGIARPTHARRADPTDGRLPRQRTWPGYAAIHDLLNKPARRAALLQHLAAGRAASSTAAAESGPGAWKCEQCGEFGNADTHLCKRGGTLPDGWDQTFADFAASHPAQGRPLDSTHYAGYQPGEVRSLPISMVPELDEVSRSLGERFNRISGYTLVLRGPAGDAFTREEEADLRRQVEALGLTLTAAADRRTLEIAARDEPVFRARHREAVAQALAAGESVAPAILADYPEVVAKQRAREKAARAVRAIQVVAARYGGILHANAQGKVKVSTLTEAAQTRSQQARADAVQAAREKIDVRPGKGLSWELVNTATNQVMLRDPKKDVLLRWNERRAEQAGQRAFQSRAATERSSLSAALQALMDPTEPIGSAHDEVLDEAQADPHYGEMVRELRTAREVLTLTAGILAAVGVPARSAARSAFAQQLVRHIPRCAGCGRFLPTQDPQCSNPRCDLVGARQGAPVPWPPAGMSFKSSRVKPARSSILYDEGESDERSTSDNTANGSGPERSGAEDSGVLAGVSPDNGAGTRSRGRTPGTGEPVPTPGGGGDHALPGAEPAAVADHGADHPDLALSPREPAATTRPRRSVSSGTASTSPEATRSLDEEIDRLFGEREQGAGPGVQAPTLATEVDTRVPAGVQAALQALVEQNLVLLALANGQATGTRAEQKALVRAAAALDGGEGLPPYLLTGLQTYEEAQVQAAFGDGAASEGLVSFAQAICLAAGTQRCATCGQFLGETAHECPAGSPAADAAVVRGLPATPPGETGGVAPESLPSPFSSTAEEGERDSSLILEDTEPPMPSGTDYRIDTGQFRPPRFPEEWTETNLQMQRNVAALALLGRLQAQERAATETEQKSLAQWRPWTTMSLNYVQWKDRQAAWWQARNPHEHRLVRRPEVPAPIAAQLWAALAHMGFTGGTVLDTHGGIGDLFSTMPEALRATTRRVMLVPDDQEAAIAAQLQQTTTVKQTSLAEAEYPHDTFDVVLAVPSPGPVADPSFSGRQVLTKKAADYYAARGLDLTKPGGIVVVLGQVTRESAEVRAALEAQADLVGQARLKLPDLGEQEVLFLRKRFPDQDPSPEALRLADAPGPALDFQPLQAQASLAALEAQFAALPPDGFRVGAARCARCGAWVSPDGDCRNPRCGQTRSRTRRTRQLPADAPDRLAHASVLAAATHALLAARTDGAGLSEVETAQAVLTAAYDDFQARYGALSSTANRAVLRDHQEVALLLSLEELDAATGAVRPTALVRPTTLPDATFVAAPLSLEDALKTTLNEGGTLNPWRLAALTGTSPHEVETALVAQGLAFRVPGGGLQVADEYLSGNVRQKLREARMAAELDPAFAVNVRALQGVVPPDLTPAEIRVNLGATWIDVADIEAFIQHLLPVGGDKIAVRYLAATGEWKVDTSRYRDSKRADNTTKWGAGGRTAVQLLRNALNGQRPTSTAPDPTDPTGQRRIVDEEATFAARAKQEEIKEEFIRWLWSDVARARRLTGRYNDLFNAVLPRQYDGSHLTLPGLAPDAEPFYPHQKDAIYRALQGKNTLLGLATGAGKSRTAQATSQEWKRLGQVQTPLHVLLDNTIDDYAAAFQALYPDTKLLVVRTKDINSRAKRAAFMAKFAGGEYDALLMSQGAFKAIPVEAADMEEITREEVSRFDDTIALLEKEGTKQSSEEAQRLRRERDKLANLYKKRLTIAGEDEPLTWGRLQALGVGGMIVDESHFYKEGSISSKNSRARKQGSARAVDLFVKMRHLSARNGGGHVMWMSGTPVTNNVLSESYWNTLCVRPDLLEERGITSYDSFVATFAQMAEVPVPTIDGQGFNLVEKPVKIVNLPDLMRLQHEMGTFKLDARELGLPLPELAGGQVEMVECPPSPRMQAALARFAQRVREGTHPFLLSNEMRHLSLMGARHYDPDFDDPASKTNVLVPALVESYEASRERRGTQIVFCDLATPSGRERRAGYSIYDEIKEKLVAQGIPAEEIAFSHDARTDTQMTKLQADVNEGNVRVLIASREQMGTGVNIQERVTDVHHLDLPWNAARFEQSTARGVRQGNQNEEVRVRAYISAPADVFVANKIKEKAELAAAMYRGEATSREIESDSDIAVNYAEMEALATGNPLVLERFQVANEVRRLEAIQAQWVQSQATARLQQALLQEKHRAAGRKVAQNERAAEVWEATLKEMPLVTGRVGVAELGEKALNQTLLEAAEQMQRERRKAGVVEGEFCG